MKSWLNKGKKRKKRREGRRVLSLVTVVLNIGVKRTLVSLWVTSGCAHL